MILQTLAPIHKGGLFQIRGLNLHVVHGLNKCEILPLRGVITVKPRPEAHMDMILFEVFLKNIHLIPQDQIVQ